MIRLIENLDDYSQHGFREKYKKFISKIKDITLRKAYGTALKEFINLFNNQGYEILITDKYHSHRLNGAEGISAFHPFGKNSNSVILFKIDEKGNLDLLDIFDNHKKAYSPSILRKYK